MPVRNSRTFWTALAIFAAPLLVVKGAAFISAGSTAPASAEAGTPAHPLPQQGVSRIEITDAHRLAMARAKDLAASTVRSPFAYTPLELPEAPEVPMMTVKPELSPPPDVHLQAIMGGSRPSAVIDGRLYHENDPIDEGWILAEIDSTRRVVVLSEPSTGRSITVAVNTRSGDSAIRQPTRAPGAGSPPRAPSTQPGRPSSPAQQPGAPPMPGLPR